jgi:hypothetical protein
MLPSGVNAILFRRGLAVAAIHNWSIHRWMMAYVVFTIVLLLTSETNFDYYWIWWIPFFLPYSCPGWVVRQKVSPSLSKYDDAGQFVVA